MTNTDQRSLDGYTLQSSSPISIHDASKQSLHSGHDGIAHSEVGERPVREKLRNTAISSQRGSASPEPTGKDTMDTAGDGPVLSGSKRTETPTVSDLRNRARPAKKRSLEDLAAAGFSNNGFEDPPTPSSGLHLRKRPRDILGDSVTRPDDHQRTSRQPLRHDVETGGSREGANDVLYGGPTVPIEPASSICHAGHVTQEPLQSPKKKRSRDELDGDTPREQKIPTTHETRARLSSDEERPDLSDMDKATPSPQRSRSNGHASLPHTEAARKARDNLPSAKACPSQLEMYSGAGPTFSNVPSTGGFSNTAATSPFAALTGSQSHSAGTTSQQNGAGVTRPAQAPSSAFAASGFAALSGADSPFATFPASSKSPAPDSAILSSASPFGMLSGLKKDDVAPPSAFGGVAGAAFGSTASGFGAMTGSGFRSGFQGGFGTGAKLTSFAAPIGDTKLGSGTSRAFGAAEDSEGEGSGSDGEDGEDEGAGQKHEAENGAKHAKQDIDTGEEDEETVFSNRGKLHIFQSNTWKERGIGTFKLNVRRRDPDGGAGNARVPSDEAEARFLMRANATHRVILNVPIFKEMAIHDPSGLGEAPKGKFIRFSGIIDGETTQYLLKMAREEETRTLYRAVKDVQEKM